MTKGASKLLSTVQAMQRWGVSDRTLRNWVADGCPVSRPDGVKKPVYEVDAVEAWLASRADKLPKAAAGKVALPLPGPVDAAAGDGKAQVAPADGQARAAAGSDSELLDLRLRLRNAERMTHARYEQALSRPDMTIGELTAYRRDWQDTVDRVQKLEKEITSIMAERGEFISAAEASEVVTRAVSVMVQALDRLGIICGDRIAGMAEGAGRALTAGDYRAVVEMEVQRIKVVMQEQIQAMVEGKGA